METKTNNKIKNIIIGFLKAVGIILAILIVIAVILLSLILHDWKDTYKEYDTTNKYIVFI